MNLKKLTVKDKDGNTIIREFDIPKPQSIPHPGQPQGTDTVPAWLTPGEFVVNAEANRMFGDQIEQMNEAGRAVQRSQGGSIPQYHAKGGCASSQPVYKSTGGDVPPTDTLAELSAMTGVPVDNAMPPPLDIIPEQRGPASSYNDVPTPDNLGPAPIQTTSQLNDRNRMISETGETLPGEGIISDGDQQLKADRLSRIATLENDLQEAKDTGANQQRQDNIQNSINNLKGMIGVPEIASPDVPANNTVKQFSDEETKAALDYIDAITNDAQSTEEESQIEKVSNEEQADTGRDIAEKNPGIFERVFNSLADAAKGLLDEDDLAEAAIMYLGSRAMGYSHGGSMRWAGKTYLGKQLTHRQDVQQMHKEKKYTSDSIEKFKETRDAKDLQALTVNKTKIDLTKPTVAYDKATNKRINLYTSEDDKGNKVLVTKDGKSVMPDQFEMDAYKVPGTKDWNKRVYDNSRVSYEQLKSLQQQHGTFGEGKDKMTVTDMNPRTASAKVGEWAAKNDVPAEQLGTLVEQAYADMRADAKSSGKRPKNIEAYLNQLVIRQTTNPDLFMRKGEAEQGQSPYIDAGKLTVINNKLRDIAEANGATGNISDLSNMLYNNAYMEWSKLTPEQRADYDARANDNENGFYIYLVTDVLGTDGRNGQ